jgi:hypothetical protein
MTFKIIEGERDAFERKLLETIWLGSPEEAKRMIAVFQSFPKADLHLVETESFPSPRTDGQG